MVDGTQQDFRPEARSLQGKKVWVAGHRGMVGSALVGRLAAENCEILTVDRAEVDLRRQSAVEDWLKDQRPDTVFLCAATVGGIQANSSRPAEFIFDNLAIEMNVIHAAYRAGVERLMFLGSSCMYPRLADQPIQEDSILAGPVEPTNQWYAVAKIAGLKLVQAYRRQYGCDFITAVPTNLFGIGDNFDLAASHVVPAMIRKVRDAKLAGQDSVEIWGTGTPRREFLYVDDAADALVFLMKHYSAEAPINVAGGQDVSIRELAEMVAEVIGFDGKFVYDTTKPDGMPRKALDAQKLLAGGWKARIGLREGLQRTYEWFLAGNGIRLDAV
jgi:GDP-L-fucose synthase